MLARTPDQQDQLSLDILDLGAWHQSRHGPSDRLWVRRYPSQPEHHVDELVMDPPDPEAARALELMGMAHPPGPGRLPHGRDSAGHA